MISGTTESFRASLTALDAARGALRAGSPEATDSIKRIAGRIADVARAAGLSRAASAAAALQAANSEDVANIVDSMVAFIVWEITGALQQRQTILVIEDDHLTQALVRDILEAERWRVLIADTAEAARELIEQENISLILLDLLLPDADGREILLRLRADPRTAFLPVIVLTAKDDTVSQSECYALGADGFLAKPVDGKVIISAVSARLQRSQQRQLESNVDALTQLPNRTEFWDSFERALSQRDGSTLSIAVLNVDRFRGVNDAYGHNTGDEVLRIVARVLSDCLRPHDFLARWGGTEFCVFLPRTELRAAKRIIQEALRRLSETQITSLDGRRFNVTFCAGVASVCAGVGGGDALAQADRLLFSAKTAGGNCVLSAADTRLPSGRVLIADDDAGTRMLVQKILEREGFDVCVCADGTSALATASRGDFSIAIIDVTMPGMNGFELVQNLRALPKFQQVPIVMLTGLDAESDIVRGFDLGVSDYVVKPFNRAEFVARIWRLLKRR
jgi:diguanylate cyclase (GGDEF)-like protein